MTKLHQPDLSSLALLFFAVSIIPGGVCEGAEVTEIAQRRQLFLDRLLIDRLDGAWLRMHEPVRREKVLHLNKPWEGIISWCPVVLRDGDRYQMWYRSREKSSAKNHVFVGYAESSDGIAWERPELGLFEFEGSKANNICIDGRHMSNVGLFIDHNPQTPPDARYKAVGLGSDNGRSAILGMVSPDGIHWRPAKEGALVLGTKDDPVFEAPQGAFWDPRQQRYAIYTRGWRHPDADGRIRSIRMTTSKDFVNWEPFQYIRLANGKWPEELYTNSAQCYYRAPLYLMFPKRFLTKRKFPPVDWPHPGVSDVLLLASRDGVHFTQPVKEAFLRPGLDPKNWHERAIYIGPCVVKTGDSEMSLYALENYRTDNIHIRRLTLREDGFVSIHAAQPAGKLLTQPLSFSGNRLEINYSTSAAGEIRVEITNASGEPISGFSAEDCELIYGDQITRTVRWKRSADVGRFAGKPVRLCFKLREADLYSFRFYED